MHGRTGQQGDRLAGHPLRVVAGPKRREGMGVGAAGQLEDAAFLRARRHHQALGGAVSRGGHPRQVGVAGNRAPRQVQEFPQPGRQGRGEGVRDGGDVARAPGVSSATVRDRPIAPAPASGRRVRASSSQCNRRGSRRDDRAGWPRARSRSGGDRRCWPPRRARAAARPTRRARPDRPPCATRAPADRRPIPRSPRRSSRRAGRARPPAREDRPARRPDRAAARTRARSDRRGCRVGSRRGPLPRRSRARTGDHESAARARRDHSRHRRTAFAPGD